MVFSKEHKRLNKILYELRGLNARQIMMEFPNKGCKKCIINRLLHKLRNDDTVDSDTAALEVEIESITSKAKHYRQGVMKSVVHRERS